MKYFFLDHRWTVPAVVAGAIIVLGVGLFLAVRPPLIARAKLVEIPEQANAADIAHILKREHVIRHESWFRFLTRRRHVQDKLQAGVYEFYGRVRLGKVIEKLVGGQVAMIRITVPEGATCADIGRLLENKKITTESEFVAYARTNKLEGFLFPDTYFFPLQVTKETVANTALVNFEKNFAEIYGRPISRENQKEVKRIVTVASIVEKEAGLDSERPVIAAIFYLRLRKGMYLQSCSTVEYALGRHKARLKRSDLEIPSEYNTYRHRGLPPTPICNPGKKSLQAALHPVRTDYLFFVTKGDGTHFFSRTYAEHVRARQVYLSGEIDTDSALPVAP